MINMTRKELRKQADIPCTGTTLCEEGRSPSQEEIAKLAYEFYLKRGGAHGNDWTDWFQAEKTLEKSRG